MPIPSPGEKVSPKVTDEEGIDKQIIFDLLIISISKNNATFSQGDFVFSLNSTHGCCFLLQCFLPHQIIGTDLIPAFAVKAPHARIGVTHKGKICPCTRKTPCSISTRRVAIPCPLCAYKTAKQPSKPTAFSPCVTISVSSPFSTP